MKKATTALFLMAIMSFTTYSFSQNATYESVKNNQCSWNDQTQQKDLCQEVLSTVQLNINRTENRIFIITDGNESVFRIDEERVLNISKMEFSLTSADGTSWEMIINVLENTVWMDMNNSHSTDSISYILN